MQKAYIQTLYNLMKEDKNVISCLSDSGTDYDVMIAREFPEQVINFGIAENNQVGVASGLAAMGKLPFVYTTNAFLAYRSYEQIRDDICLQNRNVKIVGMGCGISWSTLGPTHHTTEDISALKAIPNLEILSPATPLELIECMKYAYNKKGPVYIRIGMGNEPELFDENTKFNIQKNKIIEKGKDAVIFSTGSIISEVLEARKLLLNDNINIEVINITSIKPFDNKSVITESRKHKLIISVEEHNVIGGIGSSIADVIACNNLNSKLYKIGIDDKFAIGYGTFSEVKIQNKLDSKSIYEKIKEIINENK